jgi:mannan endo-1,4-beta-mannosidase
MGKEKENSRLATRATGQFAVAGLTALASFVTVAALGLFGSRPAAAEPPSPDAEPANPDANPEARALLRKLCEISGRFTLTGQQNFPEDLALYSERVFAITERSPAIFGQDFGFADFDRHRARMIAEAERQHRRGAVVALTWHAPRPNQEKPTSYEDSVQGKLTDEEWTALLTPGSGIYNRWVSQVDEIAVHLRQLQAAQIPVLFRPYHEINAQWFWWGGRRDEHGSAALYRQLYDRFLKVHQLNNLLWVWNANAPGKHAGPIDAYYPGPSCVDVVTMDIYGEFRRRYYDRMLALAGNKPIALAEVGALPTLDVLKSQPRWAYFMIWRGFEEKGNSPEQLRAMFHAPNVLSCGDPRFVAPTAEGDPTPDKKA